MSKTIILFIFLPGYEIRAVYDPGPRPHGSGNRWTLRVFGRALHGRLQITEGLSGKSDFTISPPPEQTPAGFRLLVRQSLFVDMDAAPGSRMRVVPCSRGKTAA